MIWKLQIMELRFGSRVHVPRATLRDPLCVKLWEFYTDELHKIPYLFPLEIKIINMHAHWF